MKVTSGKCSGINLLCPKSAMPTTDKIKQAIFSAIYSRLESFEGKKVLDMFAGSGQLGIEALSRGADLCVFIDNSTNATGIIRENIHNCKLNSNFEIVETDFERFQTKENFDIIFLDPPYQKNLLQKAFKLILDKNLAHNETLIICESNKEITYTNQYQSVFENKYGTIYVSILRLRK